MSDAVVTETRTEVSVEEVTETRYRCHVCEMLYEGDAVIQIGLDRRPDGDGLFSDAPREERTVCEHCVEGLFDYEADGTGAFDDSQTPHTVEPIDKITVAGLFLLLLGVSTGVAGAVIVASGGPGLLVPAFAAATALGLGVGWLL